MPKYYKKIWFTGYLEDLQSYKSINCGSPNWQQYFSDLHNYLWKTTGEQGAGQQQTECTQTAAWSALLQVSVIHSDGP